MGIGAKIKAALGMRPPRGEYAAEASKTRGSPWSFPFWDDAFNPDAIMREVAGYGRYDVYESMVDKDADISHAVRERVGAVTGLDAEILPADDSDEAAKTQQFAGHVVDAMPNFIGAIRDWVKGGYVAGFSLLEPVWDDFSWTYVTPKGEKRLLQGFYAPTQLLPRNPRYFSFRKTDRALLYDKYGYGMGGEEVPDKKFLVFTFQGRYGNRYGYSLLAPLYLIHKILKSDLKYWAMYNEKLGDPSRILLALTEYGLTKEVMVKIAEALQADSKAIIELKPPTGMSSVTEKGPLVKLDDLIKTDQDPGAGARISNFEKLYETCKRICLQHIKGTALLTEEGKGGRGSYSLGRAQVDATWLPVIADDINAVEEILNDYFFKWITEVNFGAGAPAPRWRFITDEPEDRKATAETYKAIVEAGGKLESGGEPFTVSRRQVREDLGLKEPEGGDDALKIKGGGGNGGSPFGFGGAPVAPGAAERFALADAIDAEKLKAEAQGPVTAAYEAMLRGAYAYAKKKYPFTGDEFAADWEAENEMTRPKIARLANAFVPAFQVMWLAGAWQVQQEYEGLTVRTAEAAAGTIEMTIDEFRDQLALTREEWDALDAQFRRHAWYVSRAENDWVVGQVQELVAKVPELGLDKKAFLAKLHEKFSGEVEFQPWHGEVIYRNNAASMYNGSREVLASQPHMMEAFPLRAYLAILDDRTSDICWDLRNFVAWADDPRWAWCYPPNHDLCRSGVQIINKFRMVREGLSPVDFEFRQGVAVPDRFMTSPAAFLGMA